MSEKPEKLSEFQRLELKEAFKYFDKVNNKP